MASAGDGAPASSSSPEPSPVLPFVLPPPGAMASLRERLVSGSVEETEAAMDSVKALFAGVTKRAELDELLHAERGLNSKVLTQKVPGFSPPPACQGRAASAGGSPWPTSHWSLGLFLSLSPFYSPPCLSLRSLFPFSSKPPTGSISSRPSPRSAAQPPSASAPPLMPGSGSWLPTPPPRWPIASRPCGPSGPSSGPGPATSPWSSCGRGGSGSCCRRVGEGARAWRRQKSRASGPDPFLNLPARSDRDRIPSLDHLRIPRRQRPHLRACGPRLRHLHPPAAAPAPRARLPSGDDHACPENQCGGGPHEGGGRPGGPPGRAAARAAGHQQPDAPVRGEREEGRGGKRRGAWRGGRVPHREPFNSTGGWALPSPSTLFSTRDLAPNPTPSVPPVVP